MTDVEDRNWQAAVGIVGARLDFVRKISSALNAKDAENERLRAALKPFADLAGKLDGAPNLIGLLTEADFKRAAEAFGNEQNARPIKCEGCDTGIADPPSRLCPGCQAYVEHQR